MPTSTDRPPGATATRTGCLAATTVSSGRSDRDAAARRGRGRVRGRCRYEAGPPRPGCSKAAIATGAPGLPSRGDYRRGEIESRHVVSTTPTGRGRRSATSTCTCSVRAATAGCGRSSGPTRGSTTGWPGCRSPCGRPTPRPVRVVGDWNFWDGRVHPMRSLGSSGVWELFIPGVAPGARYKYELVTADGRLVLKTDPMAFAMENPPATASVVGRRPGPRRGATRRGWSSEAGRGPADPTDVGLRGAPRLVAAHRRSSRGGDPPADLPRARRTSCPRTWPSWASPTSR